MPFFYDKVKKFLSGKNVQKQNKKAINKKSHNTYSNNLYIIQINSLILRQPCSKK